MKSALKLADSILAQILAPIMQKLSVSTGLRTLLLTGNIEPTHYFSPLLAPLVGHQSVLMHVLFLFSVSIPKTELSRGIWAFLCRSYG